MAGRSNAVARCWNVDIRLSVYIGQGHISDGVRTIKIGVELVIIEAVTGFVLSSCTVTAHLCRYHRVRVTPYAWYTR